MHHSLWLLLPVQAACDVHQAAGLSYYQGGGLSHVQVVNLPLQPFCGELGVLQRKDAAKPAALLGLRQLHDLRAAHMRQQGARLAVDLHAAQRMAGRVIGQDSIPVRAKVSDIEFIDQVFGEFIHAISQRLGARQPDGIIFE